MDKYIVKLSADERESLLALVSKGKGSARKLTHARILLEADENSGEIKTDGEISNGLYVSTKTVQRVRRDCVEEGILRALERKTHVRYKPRKLQGEEEARLIALCCSAPPEGRCRWTLKMLGDHLVRLEMVKSISPQTILNTLKKMN